MTEQAHANGPRTARRSAAWLLRAAVAGTACAAVAACAAAPVVPVHEPPGALALVVGGHANAPAPAPLPTVRKLIEQSAAEQWQATAVIDGGVPKVIAHGQMTPSSHDSVIIERRNTENANRLESVVRAAKAQSEEVDLLGALGLAGHSLEVTKGVKTIVVIDSGLQTVAPLRLQDQGVLDADPGQTADALADAGALPRLSGVRLIFTGLGDTAAPQPPLTDAGRARLIALWRTIGERAGASVEVLDGPLGTVGRAGLPAVSLVEVGA